MQNKKPTLFVSTVCLAISASCYVACYAVSSPSSSSSSSSSLAPGAGDVLVVVDGNSVTIMGDAQGNAIFIRDDGKSLVVEPIGKTLVNGGGLFTTGISAATVQNLVIDMRGGADCVTLTGQIEVNGNLNAKFGQGDDLFVTSLGTVANNVAIRMGGGFDCLDFQVSNVGGNLTYSGGSNNDIALFDQMVVGGDFTSRSGGGFDCIRVGSNLNQFQVQGDFKDFGGGGEDEAFFSGVFHQDLEYSGGGGVDCGAFGDPGMLQIDGTFTARSGAGNDLMEFGVANTAVSSTSANYFGGRGNDMVEIGDGSVFQGQIFALLGADDDVMNISAFTVFAMPGTLSGGSGIDDIDPDPTVLEGLGFNIINFEN